MAHCAPQQLQNISSSASFRSVSYGTTITPAHGQCTSSTRRQHVAAAGPPLCLCHLFRAPCDPAQATGSFKGPGVLSPGEWPFCARGCRRAAGVKGAIPRRAADCGTISRDEDCSTAFPLTAGGLSHSATIRLGSAPSVMLTPALDPRFPLAANPPTVLTQTDAMTQIERNPPAALTEQQQQLATVGSMGHGSGGTEEPSGTAAAAVPVAVSTAIAAAEAEGSIEPEPGSPSHPREADGSLSAFQAPGAARRTKHALGLAANDCFHGNTPAVTAAANSGIWTPSPSQPPPPSQTPHQCNRQSNQQPRRWQSAESAPAFGSRHAIRAARAASPVQSTTATATARQLGGEELATKPQTRTMRMLGEGLSTGRHDATVVAPPSWLHDTGQGAVSSVAGTPGSRRQRRPARDSMTMAALNISRGSDGSRADRDRMAGNSRGSSSDRGGGSGRKPREPGLRGGPDAILGLELPHGGRGGGGRNVPPAVPAAVATAAPAVDDVGDTGDRLLVAARDSRAMTRREQSRLQTVAGPTSTPSSSPVENASPSPRPSPTEACSASQRRRRDQSPVQQVRHRQRRQQQQQQQEGVSGGLYLQRSGSVQVPQAAAEAHGSMPTAAARLNDDSLHPSGSETDFNPWVGNGSIPFSSASSPTRDRARRHTDVSEIPTMMSTTTRRLPPVQAAQHLQLSARPQQRLQKAASPARPRRREKQKLRQICQQEKLEDSLLSATEAHNGRAQRCVATRELSLAATAGVPAAVAAAVCVAPSSAENAVAEVEATATEARAHEDKLPSSIASVQPPVVSWGCAGASVDALYDRNEHWDRSGERESDTSDPDDDSGAPSTSYDSTVSPFGPPPSGWRRRRMVRLFPVPRPHRRKRRALARAAAAAMATVTSVPSGDEVDEANGLNARRGRERFSFPFTVSRTSDVPIGFGRRLNGPPPPPPPLPSSLLTRPPLLQAPLQDLPQNLYALEREDGTPETDPRVIAAAVGSTGIETAPVAPVKLEWLHVPVAHPGSFAPKLAQGSRNSPAGELLPEAAASSAAMLGTGGSSKQHTATSTFWEAALQPPPPVPQPTTTDAASSYSLLAAPPFVLFAEAVPEHRVVVYRYRPTGRWVWQPLLRVTSANCIGRDLVAVTIPAVPAAVVTGITALAAKAAVDGAALGRAGTVMPLEFYLAAYPPAGVSQAYDDDGSGVPGGDEPRPAAAAAVGETQPLAPFQPVDTDQHRAGCSDLGDRCGGGDGCQVESTNRISVGHAAQAGVPKALHGGRRGGGWRTAALTSMSAAAPASGSADTALFSAPTLSLELTRPGHYLVTSTLTHGSQCSTVSMGSRGSRGVLVQPAAGQVHRMTAAAAMPPPSAESSTAEASAAQLVSQGPAPAAAAAAMGLAPTPPPVLAALSPPTVVGDQENGRLKTENRLAAPSSPFLYHTLSHQTAASASASASASAAATEANTNTVAAAAEGEDRPDGRCSGSGARHGAGGPPSITAAAAAAATAAPPSGLRPTAQRILRHDVVLVLDGSSFTGWRGRDWERSALELRRMWEGSQRVRPGLLVLATSRTMRSLQQEWLHKRTFLPQPEVVLLALGTQVAYRIPARAAEGTATSPLAARIGRDASRRPSRSQYNWTADGWRLDERWSQLLDNVYDAAAVRRAVESVVQQYDGVRIAPALSSQSFSRLPSAQPDVRTDVGYEAISATVTESATASATANASATAAQGRANWAAGSKIDAELTSAPSANGHCTASSGRPAVSYGLEKLQTRHLVCLEVYGSLADRVIRDIRERLTALASSPLASSAHDQNMDMAGVAAGAAAGGVTAGNHGGGGSGGVRFELQPRGSRGEWCTLYVLPAAAGKAAAMHYVMQRFGIDAAAVVAAGDTDRDAELLAKAGAAIVTATRPPQALRQLLLSSGEHTTTRSPVPTSPQSLPSQPPPLQPPSATAFKASEGVNVGLALDLRGCNDGGGGGDADAGGGGGGGGSSSSGGGLTVHSGQTGPAGVMAGLRLLGLL